MQTVIEEFYHLINFSIMAILKATVRFKNKSGWSLIAISSPKIWL